MTNSYFSPILWKDLDKIITEVLEKHGFLTRTEIANKIKEEHLEYLESIQRDHVPRTSLYDVLTKMLISKQVIKSKRFKRDSGNMRGRPYTTWNVRKVF